MTIQRVNKKILEILVQLPSKQKSQCKNHIQNKGVAWFAAVLSACVCEAHLTVGSSSCYDYCIGMVGTRCCWSARSLGGSHYTCPHVLPSCSCTCLNCQKNTEKQLWGESYMQRHRIKERLFLQELRVSFKSQTQRG